MAAEGLSQPKTSQLSRLPCAELSCSLGSKRPPRGPAVKRPRGTGKEGACSSPVGERNRHPGTWSGRTLVLSLRTGLALALRSTCWLLSA